MFVDCSEISIGVVVKHVQHVGIIRAFRLPGKFFSAWGGQKNVSWFSMASKMARWCQKIWA